MTHGEHMGPQDPRDEAIASLTAQVEALSAQVQELSKPSLMQRAAERVSGFVDSISNHRKLAAGVTAGVLALGVAANYEASSGEHDSLVGVETAQASGLNNSFLAQAKAPLSKTPKTPQGSAGQSRSEMIARASAAEYIPEAVHIMHSTPSNIDKNVHAIFKMRHHPEAKHTHAAQSSMLPEFPAGKLGPLNGEEAVAFTIMSSPAFTAQQYNILHGDTESKELPQGVSTQDARNFLEKAMTSDSSEAVVDKPHADLLNHGQRGEHIFDANVVHLNGDKKVLTIKTPEGKLRFKEWMNDCLNSLTPTKKVTLHVSTPTTPEHPQHVVEHPQQPHHPEHPQHPQKPHKPHKPEKPHKPHKPEQPHKPHKPEKPHHPQPKHDPNTTPAGVPGQNGGTPDKAGHGPAGQTPDASGFVPGEDHPATPAPNPTPAPIPTPETTPTAPAETGTDNGPTQPPAPSTGTGTTVTGDPGVPTGN